MWRQRVTSDDFRSRRACCNLGSPAFVVEVVNRVHHVSEYRSASFRRLVFSACVSRSRRGIRRPQFRFRSVDCSVVVILPSFLCAFLPAATARVMSIPPPRRRPALLRICRQSGPEITG
ncbi:hypothetical protein EVAR_70273_1 [Eumeta japonica]|uniref:Uncharacterized protein n=1 Tax=Eumeta variegata TaxID=151549 RepID=A0A4C2A2X5_EUMVA|nr:hypothetical protein EVAR_70273_1 [Eumeta japonica]